jgi:hypothetical protein
MSVSPDIKTPIPVESEKLPKRGKQAAGPTMATIEDDDERLLAEIGYEQVRIYLFSEHPKTLTSMAGTFTPFHEVLDPILCDLCFRSLRLGASNVW